MTAYLDYTKGLADQTPDTRNRVIDFWRAVAICVVMFGHWLAASIWLQPDDEIALMNSLEWIPYAAWVTWIVQVMPVFFFVGGYANARALRAVEGGEQRRRVWITTRVRRLFTPVIPLIVVWTVLIVVLRLFVPADVIRAGAMSATVPLWFMAVYLVLIATAPFTHRWWIDRRWWSIGVLAVAATGIDAIRYGTGLTAIGYVNFLLVWGLVHQLGYWWAERDERSAPVTAAQGWAVAAGALGALVAVTWSGLYPVAMVGVPGAGETNMTPPTMGIALLATAQAGVIWGTQRRVDRLTHRRRVWHGVVAVSGVIMTIYLWHLSAMTFVASIGLFAFDGAAFRIEPGTTAWWVTRPLWVAVLLAVTATLVALFARFEWRINPDPPPRRVAVVVAGVLLTAGASAAVAYFGLATAQAAINWIIPAMAITGAVLIGAYPKRS